jgi:hypothetical protein
MREILSTPKQQTQKTDTRSADFAAKVSVFSAY